MSRGGQRKGAGRKSTWVSGCKFADTKLIRVPAVIADEILEFAHRLDGKAKCEIVTNSKDDEDLPIFKALSANSLLLVSESLLSVKRLGLERAVLGRRRREFTSKEGAVDIKMLSGFTKEKDPDGIPWKCQRKLNGTNGFDYIPAEKLSSTQEVNLSQWIRDVGLSVQ